MAGAGIALQPWQQRTQQGKWLPYGDDQEVMYGPYGAKTRPKQSAQDAALLAARTSNALQAENMAATDPAGLARERTGVGGGAAVAGTPSPTADFNQRMQEFGQFADKFGSLFGGGGGVGAGAGSLGGGGGTAAPSAAPTSPVAALNTAAIEAGDRAAFSRAKDTVGQSTQGLLKALSNQFAGRGLRGSSMEGRAIGSALDSGVGQLADVARGQAVEGARRAENLATTQYQGDVAMRGQDVAARGQDIGAATARESLAAQVAAQQQQAKLASIMGLMSAFNGLRY